MKKIFFTILAIIFLFPLFNGCTDLLDEVDYMKPVADEYYSTEEGYNDLIRASYHYLRGWYGGRNGYALTTYGTDIWLMGADGSKKHYGQYSSAVNPTTRPVWDIWNEMYLGIATCNTAINRADEVIDIEESDKNLLVSEALFLRAMYYHIMVMHFGPVPLRLNEVTAVETTSFNTPEIDIYKQIIEDLETAETNLPITSSEYGRATKPAAQALLARVHLTLKNWEEAANYAAKVIKDYDFSLVPDFEDLWDIHNEKNSEVIWSVQHTGDERLNEADTRDGGGHWGHLLFLAEYDTEHGLKRDVVYSRPHKRFMPSRYFLNMLNASRDIDSRYDKSWREVWYSNSPTDYYPDMQIGDTALYIPAHAVSEEFKKRVENQYTVYDIDYYYDPTSPNGEVPWGARTRYPSLDKFDDPLRPTMQHRQGRRDFMVFRLSEMYLIASESLMMLGRKDEGVSFINEVRRRAAWPGKELQMEITADELTLDFILEERAKELAGEMLRWSDLKRTGTLIERVKLYNPDARDNIKPYHLLRPIPQEEMDRVSNKDEFKQNPGY